MRSEAVSPGHIADVGLRKESSTGPGCSEWSELLLELSEQGRLMHRGSCVNRHGACSGPSAAAAAAGAEVCSEVLPARSPPASAPSSSLSPARPSVLPTPARMFDFREAAVEHQGTTHHFFIAESSMPSKVAVKAYLAAEFGGIASEFAKLTRAGSPLGSSSFALLEGSSATESHTPVWVDDCDNSESTRPIMEDMVRWAAFEKWQGGGLREVAS